MQATLPASKAPTITLSTLLKRSLQADAAVALASAATVLIAADPLSDALGFSTAFLRGVGVVILPLFAILAFLGTRERTATALIWITIVLNSVWAIASLGLLLTDWVNPTGLGYAFVIVQALIVALFAELEYLGLRKSLRGQR